MESCFLCRSAFSKGGCDCQPGQEGLFPAPRSVDRRVTDFGLMSIPGFHEHSLAGAATRERFPGKGPLSPHLLPLTCGFGGD